MSGDGLYLVGALVVSVPVVPVLACRDWRRTPGLAERKLAPQTQRAAQLFGQHLEQQGRAAASAARVGFFLAHGFEGALEAVGRERPERFGEPGFEDDLAAMLEGLLGAPRARRRGLLRLAALDDVRVKLRRGDAALAELGGVRELLVDRLPERLDGHRAGHLTTVDVGRRGARCSHRPG